MFSMILATALYYNELVNNQMFGNVPVNVFKEMYDEQSTVHNMYDELVNNQMFGTFSCAYACE